MRDIPDIARIATLVGERARADMLMALMADRALTATELAVVAGVTRQTASAHLARLKAAGLVVITRRGRHRHVRLAGSDVAELIERLMAVAFRTGALRPRVAVGTPALSKARLCYDHMAGELAVEAFEAMLMRGWFRARTGELDLSEAGHDALAELGIAPARIVAARRIPCGMCADWGEGRHHLAGALGAAILEHVFACGWAGRTDDSRVLSFRHGGEAAFRATFMLD